MRLFDIGANRGDAVSAGLRRGFDEVIAIEPAPRVFLELVRNFIYSPSVKILRFAVSDSTDQTIEFYEAEEDGLSTINIDWLTSDNMPYKNKPYRTIKANTITMDRLVEIYGTPDLTKIDVEGAEWSVFRGMTEYCGMLTFEWTDATLSEHQKQLEYLLDLGYSEVAPQFIVEHLDEPSDWHVLKSFDMSEWVRKNAPGWTGGGWRKASLRPTADVGMLWVR